PGNASVPEDQRFPAGVVPNGMARTPTGEFLITMSDGRILRYGANGHRKSNGAGGFVDFAASLGQGDLKIAVGLPEGKVRAFVTHQQRGELRRFNFAANGTGVLDATLNDFQFPIGVASTVSNTVPVPPGQNIDVAPLSLLTSNVQLVTLGGLVNATVSLL